LKTKVEITTRMTRETQRGRQQRETGIELEVTTAGCLHRPQGWRWVGRTVARAQSTMAMVEWSATAGVVAGVGIRQMMKMKTMTMMKMSGRG